MKAICTLRSTSGRMSDGSVPIGSTHQKDSNLSWTTLTTPMCLEPSIVFSQLPDGSIPPLRMRHMPPMYPPPIWNVNSITLEGGSRTNNICEGWNNAFAKLVGHAHPTIWRAIDSIRKDQAQVATALLRDLRGEPPAKHVRRHTHKHQDCSRRT